MARTSIAVQTCPFQGEIDDIQWTAADQANGMMFPNDGRTILLARNTNASVRNITVVSVPDQWGRTGDLTVTVAANTGIALVGPLTPGVWNQRSGADAGNVYLNFDADTGLEVAAVRLRF